MNYTRPCRYHSYARQSCAACNAKRFDPRLNAKLAEMKLEWLFARSDSDRPGDVTDLRDGVLVVRPFGLDDLIDWVEREVEGEVS